MVLGNACLSFSKRLLPSMLLCPVVLFVACGKEPTGPSQSVQLASISYEHDNDIDPASSRRPQTVHLSSSTLDAQGRRHQTSCALEQTGPRQFQCTRVFWWCEVGPECGVVQVHGLETPRATGISINGQPLRRIEVFDNGAERAFFRLEANGVIR